MKKWSKNASLNLSINAIVIVVLAMTLLGLGLGFIKSQIGQIGETSTQVQQQIAEQIEGQLRASGEKMSFQREINIAKGDRKVLTLGIQNVDNEELHFKINISVDESNTDPGLYSGLTEKNAIRYDGTCLSLDITEAQTYGINVKAPSKSGTAAIRATVKKYSKSDCTGNEDTYSTKLSYITVG
ncbi:hypothetical protein GF336_06085 [Candidatus Woesearchaeota archaeon]|nr:hypothetical protein [Candidatus Woesearchaeota archaeon]